MQRVGRWWCITGPHRGFHRIFKGRRGSIFSTALFFTPHTEYANRFAGKRRKEFRDSDGYIAGTEGANVMPAFVSFEKSGRDRWGGLALMGDGPIASVIREILLDAQKKGSMAPVFADGRTAAARSSTSPSTPSKSSPPPATAARSPPGMRTSLYQGPAVPSASAATAKWRSH